VLRGEEMSFFGAAGVTCSGGIPTAGLDLFNVPYRLVAFVAYFCWPESHSKPHGQPETESYDRDKQIFPVIHRIEVIADLFSAIPAMNGLFLVHVSSS
jgi:hypothetical protein